MDQYSESPFLNFNVLKIIDWPNPLICGSFLYYILTAAIFQLIIESYTKYFMSTLYFTLYGYTLYISNNIWKLFAETYPK